MIEITINSGYGGNGVDIKANIDDTQYVIDRDFLIDMLTKQIIEKGYTTSKTARQKYPRLIINI